MSHIPRVEYREYHIRLREVRPAREDLTHDAVVGRVEVLSATVRVSKRPPVRRLKPELEARLVEEKTESEEREFPRESRVLARRGGVEGARSRLPSVQGDGVADHRELCALHFGYTSLLDSEKEGSMAKESANSLSPVNLTGRGVARIWFRGATHFGGGRPPFFSSDPKSQSSPLCTFGYPRIYRLTEANFIGRRLKPNKVTSMMRVEAPRQFLPNVRSSGLAFRLALAKG